MVGLGQAGRFFAWHAIPHERSPEGPNTAFPSGLKPKEAHPDRDREDRGRGHEDERQAVAVACHHSSPSRRRLNALEIMPPRFREDVYSWVSLNACSSVIPLSFKVL